MNPLSTPRESLTAPAALELAANRVAAATIDWRGGQGVVSHHAVELLPAGALTPSLTGANVIDRATVSAAVNRVLDRLGRPRRIGLIVPDPVAKVSLVRFEQVPARAQDLDQLVRWQVRKAAPFPIEEAQVSYVPALRGPALGTSEPDGQEFLVTMARRDVVQEYENLCTDAGAHAGVVDLSTFNVINSVLAEAGAPWRDADWLLVNVAPDYASLAILRGPDLVFFRNRSAEADGTLADLVHQTAMYYQDRLKGTGFTRVILAGASGATGPGADIASLRSSLEERLGAEVEMIDPRRVVSLADRISASPSFLDALAPLVGMLLRGREKAA